MALICPTLTANNLETYRHDLKIITSLPCTRIHIDLMDGVFAPTKSPSLAEIYWPVKNQADIHLMYQKPMDYLDRLIKLSPRMVIIHNEADVHHMHFAAELHKAGILAGLAILKETPIEYAFQIMHSFDHVLIFSGNLGYQGGEADLSLLDKVKKAKDHHPEVEISWDGGINDKNAKLLLNGGVDVLYVGGYIHNNIDPYQAYAKLNILMNE